MGTNFASKRTMIIGGGKAATTLLNEIFNAKNSPYEGDKSAALYDPICIIDCDPSKFGTFINGVEVVGGNDLIIDKAKELLERLKGMNN